LVLAVRQIGAHEGFRRAPEFGSGDPDEPILGQTSSTSHSGRLFPADISEDHGSLRLIVGHTC
jgi:hypothetical protein